MRRGRGQAPPLLLCFGLLPLRRIGTGQSQRKRRATPERAFYGYDHYLESRSLGYRGPQLGYWVIPDQFTVARFEQLDVERVIRAEVGEVFDHLGRAGVAMEEKAAGGSRAFLQDIVQRAPGLHAVDRGGAGELGGERKLRGKDGISFFKAGNNKFAQLVLSSIQSGKRDRATARVTVAAPQSQMHEAERSVPLFGQSLTLGGILTFEPKDIHADALVVAGVGIKPSAAFQAIRNVTVDGSDAAKLLRRGEIAPVPKGRADDFSLPPEIKAQ